MELDTQIMKRVFVFDIDGTLANLDHRLHFVKNKPKNWGAFNSLLDRDSVIEQTKLVLDSLVSSGYKIIFLSGREGSEKSAKKTEKWIKDNLDLEVFLNINLFMRKTGDYRSDDLIKLELMKEFVEPHYKVIAIFDDRPKVVKMWRENGYFVFDVNQSGRDF